MSVLSHNKLEEILLVVRDLKRNGASVMTISHELTRRGYRPESDKKTNRPNWQGSHIINFLQELRDRGELPPSGSLPLVRSAREKAAVRHRAGKPQEPKPPMLTFNLPER